MKRTKSKINSGCVQAKRVGDVVPGVMVSYTHNFPPIVINGKELSVSNSVKILGVTISSDLKWNEPVSYTHLTLPTIYSV